jgi:hypothetical protein
MSFMTDLIVLNSVQSGHYASCQIVFIAHTHVLEFLYYGKSYTDVWP